MMVLYVVVALCRGDDCPPLVDMAYGVDVCKTPKEVRDFIKKQYDGEDGTYVNSNKKKGVEGDWEIEDADEDMFAIKVTKVII